MPDVSENNTNSSNDRIAAKLRRIFPNGCNKILLIEPPNVAEEDYDISIALDNRYPVYPPTGLAILKTGLERRGYEVEILDLNFMLQEYLKNKPEDFQYSIWKKWLDEKIKIFKPELIGLTCMFSIYHRQLVRTAEFIAVHFPKIIIFAGGVSVTTSAELVLRDCPDIDFVCLFEGNECLAKIVDFVNVKTDSDGLTQIASLIKNKYITLDARIPTTEESLNLIPDYGDLKIGAYSSLGRIGTFFWLLKPGIRAATVLANRGCRGHCRCCAVRYFNGQGVSRRSTVSVLDELEMLRDSYGIGHIMWLDDDLFYDPAQTIKLFDGIVKRNLNITWDASNGVIASSLTEEIADAADKSGCIALSFGIESGNVEILKHIRKPSGLKHYRRAAETMQKYPAIFTKGLLMVGFISEPEAGFAGENIGMIWDTINLANDMGLDWYTIQPLTLIAGTDITDSALARGIIKKRELINGTERPHTGSTGSQIRRDVSEKNKAKDFRNLLREGLDYVPTREEISDIWFVMDYLVNYPKISLENRPIKLGMLHKLFANMCDHTHKENALGSLYFAELEMKLGNIAEARRRIAQAKQFSKNSAYWQKRFSVLGLDRLMNEMANGGDKGSIC